MRLYIPILFVGISPCEAYTALEVGVVPNEPSWMMPAGLLLILLLLCAVGFLWVLNRRLLRSKHKLMALWRHIPDVLTEVDENGHICALNQPLSEALPPEQVVGTSSYDYLNEEDSALFRRHLDEAIRLGKQTQYELTAQLPDGYRYLSNRIVPLLSGGHEQRALVITSDITHHKEAEKILQRAKAQAEENAQAKTQFLANMSHEIRTPLSGIVGMVSLIEDTYQSEEMHQYTQPLLTSVDHLQRIVDDVLDLAKSNAGEIELEEVDTSIWQIFDDLESLYSPQAIQKHLNLSVNIHPDVPRMVISDPFRLRQVLYNLLSNAMKFTDDGSVTINIEKTMVSDQPMLRIAVIDTGLGIEEDRQQAIFDAFSQGRASTTRTHGGTGLGLSICKNLVEIMGGLMGVNSELGKGAEFWFTLPLRDSQENAVMLSFGGLSIYLSIENGRHRKWFQDFFMALKLPVKDYTEGHELDEHSLLVTDTAQPQDAAFLWWLGPDYELKLPQGVVLIDPIRREALVQRLEAYAMENQAEEMTTEGAISGPLLLVEDNLTNQLVVKTTLEKMGYTVDVANNGQEGVDAYGEKEYAGVIMDIQMPVMDGIEATRKIRQMPGRYVPIVALTANAQDTIEEACFAAGMDAFLTKPINRMTLQETLEGLMGAQVSRGSH
jgi:PAS domain S-box-containing protein